jgi:ASCH domain
MPNMMLDLKCPGDGTRPCQGENCVECGGKLTVKVDSWYRGNPNLSPEDEAVIAGIMTKAFNKFADKLRDAAGGTADHDDQDDDDDDTWFDFDKPIVPTLPVRRAPRNRDKLPAKAISLKQPWAWLVVNGHKLIENRSWPTPFRGRVLIHASKSWDSDNFPFSHAGQFQLNRVELPYPNHMPDRVEYYLTGGIVGEVTITGCVKENDDPWFFGPFGFLLKDARSLPFVPCRGALQIFDVPENIRWQIEQKLAEQEAEKKGNDFDK